MSETEHNQPHASPFSNEGRGLKRDYQADGQYGLEASPFSNEGRGLKPLDTIEPVYSAPLRPSAMKGVD